MVPSPRFRLHEGRAVWQNAIRRITDLEEEVPGGKPLGMMERNLAYLRTDRKGNGDILVERRFITDLTEGAAIVIVDAFEAAKTLDDAAALRAEKQPIHGEEAERGGVEEKVDGLALGQVPLAGEAERIDAKQRRVIGGPDVTFELGDEPRAP